MPATSNVKLVKTMEGIKIYRFRYFISKWQRLAYSGGVMANLKENRLLYFLIPFYVFFQPYSVVSLVKKIAMMLYMLTGSLFRD